MGRNPHTRAHRRWPLESCCRTGAGRAAPAGHPPIPPRAGRRPRATPSRRGEGATRRTEHGTASAHVASRARGRWPHSVLGASCPWSAREAEECKRPVSPVPQGTDRRVPARVPDQSCRGADGENVPAVLPETLVQRAGGAQELAFLTSSQVRPCCWPTDRAHVGCPLFPREPSPEQEGSPHGVDRERGQGSS